MPFDYRLFWAVDALIKKARKDTKDDQADYKGNGFHIYQIQETEFEWVRYRVDCGDEGSFEIAHSHTEEVWNSFGEDWDELTIEGFIYRDWHDFQDEYPELKSERALEIVSQ